uniref:Isoaspartyl peptidase/L-asparaginase n=1 Tax=Macrostomum lignano TaxID=282301 RepID=A0A1I8GJC1_9PLAT
VISDHPQDSELTNAGRGSCLSRDGSVQCDAGVMLDSRGLFAGVGALPGLVRRPVLVARCLLESQLQSPLLPGGLIPPSLLVGHGALDWARANCRDCDVGFVESDNALVTPAARTAYLKYSRLLEAAEEQQQQQRLGPRKRRAESPDSSPSGESTASTAAVERQLGNGGHRCWMTPAAGGGPVSDTVGAICLDSSGRIAVACSSGGVALKQPGRVGQAAIFGCGCWAESVGDAGVEDDDGGSTGVGCVTSGAGEYLVRCQLAQTCARAALRRSPRRASPAVVSNGDCGGSESSGSDIDAHRQDDLASVASDCLRREFLGHAFMEGVELRDAGLLLIRRRRQDPNLPLQQLEFLYGHTTEAMCVGWRIVGEGDGEGECEAVVSRQGTITDQSHRNVCISGSVYRL